jgi:hypothetical protein
MPSYFPALRKWLRQVTVREGEFAVTRPYYATGAKPAGATRVTPAQAERIQPTGGRLDLLLQHIGTKRRYEVEIQLGMVDESNIIRTVEYRDIEKKRYPQYDHCAVIVAEDITNRFLNVIALFNGTIPLIAIQMRAYTVGSYLTPIWH